ncbi:MAG: hypothetical protein M3014_12595, partial [Chloroflexota bacterium]|nr:hypothetical protein [Chloroflexota bacterium]
MTLDLIVGQSALATGFKLVSLDSLLGHQVRASGAGANIKDTGQWHIELKDDKGQTLALNGALDYTVEGQLAGAAAGNATIKVAGTLKNDDTAVDIDALVSGGSANGHSIDNGKFTLTLTRNGHASHTLITKAVDVAQIGYDLNRTTTRNTIERDGYKAGRLQTVTVRDLGSGEQEMWLERSVDGPTIQSPPIVINQHLFQRAAGTGLSQYIDRFDAQMPDGTYSLQAPVTIKVAASGLQDYSFALLNGKGQTIKIALPDSTASPQSRLENSRQEADGVNTASTKAVAGLAAPLSGGELDMSGSARAGISLQSDLEVATAARSMSGGPGLFSPLASPCSEQANFLLGIAMGVVLALVGMALLPELLAIGAITAEAAGAGEAALQIEFWAAEAEAAAANVTTAELNQLIGSETIEQVIQTLIQKYYENKAPGLLPGDPGYDNAKAKQDILSTMLQIATAFAETAASGGRPGFDDFFGALGNTFQAALPDIGSYLCNGDPYFVNPDIRPISDPAQPGPVQITSVTGGLVAPNSSTLSDGVTTTATAPLSSTIGTTGATANTRQYNDSPMAFMGGSVPTGAKAMGTWAWDSARPYGAMPSHTQPATDGPQVHYFIHAASPLTPTTGDNIIQYMYIDPKNPPSEVYMQFYTGDGNGEQRAYWGANSTQTGGQAGSGSLYPMGPLSHKGGWVRLQVPAAELGLEGKPINGVLYGAYNGQTWWGPTTLSNRQTDEAPDGMSVEPPLAPPTWTVGSIVAFRLSEPQRVSMEIVDGQGKLVRTLLKNEPRQAGYQALTWDARNNSGAVVQDLHYQARFSVGGKVLAQHGVTISPLVADIRTPGAYSLVRGTQVPIVGEAYGNMFDRYVLEYGAGSTPSTWITITESTVPSLAMLAGKLKLFNPGNLANWDTGLDEFKPWHEAGLNGLYTLRLRVIGTDGREADDSFPVIVGRLADTAQGGTISSSDGLNAKQNAHLTIPYFATHDSFSLMALIPLSQTETTTNWRPMLPIGPRLAGDAYEVFPADEKFRRPATLELPYSGTDPPDHVGIMLGDGTPGGWRYIGGKADPQKHTVTVLVMGFGGKRALVAPFVSGTFGLSPDPTKGARLAFSDTLAAPSVTPDNGQVAFYSDLQSGPGEWENLDLRGTKIEIATGTAAGLAAGDSALKVVGGVTGARMIGAHTSPYDAEKYPILSFDYRVPAGYAPNLIVKSNGTWYSFWMGTGGTTSSTPNALYFETLLSPQLVTDDTWRHYRLDLLGRLRLAEPDATKFQVEAIAFVQISQTAYMQFVPVDGGKESAYYLDNLAASRPTSTAGFNFSWTVPQGSSYDSYSYALDQNRDTLPAENAGTTTTSSTSVHMQLPPGAVDGLWYFHVRGHATGQPGQWGAAAHYPLQIDRQPPSPGVPSPSPNGAGSPDLLQLPVADAGGVDLASLKLALGGKTYSAGSGGRTGLSYQPDNQTLSIYPNQLNPPLASPAGGQQVQASLMELTDYAGNTLATPFLWSFTSDRPQTGGASGFRQLTAKGGTSPAVSPDGSQVAFVSSRSGAQKIWVMRADDFGEKAGSALPLTSGGQGDTNAHQSDPAWSPDGSTLAFVSDTGGPPNIWVSAANGTGARALTAATNGAVSPTWTDGGKVLAFISDGNLWSVNSDGTGLRALTSYPEKPLRAVSAQPQGGRLLAVEFRLYQQTIELYNPANGELTPITEGGQDTEPAWLNDSTLLFTAPSKQANQAGLLAVWQVGLDGHDQSPLAGMSQAGVAGMQPSASLEGNGLALVSTEGGDRNVWVSSNLQIGSLKVLPVAATMGGEPFRVTYTLPATCTVTLQVTDKAGKVVGTLVPGIAQARGVQQSVWDGKDTGGNIVSPGDYLVSLSARKGDGPELTRYASAKVLASSGVGAIQVEIDQWAGQLASPNDTMHTRVYAAGTRSQPQAHADSGSRPRFSLPAGRY